MNKDEQAKSDVDNLVMFPASKNYPLSKEVLDDPLEDLLNEFSHITDEDLGLPPLDENGDEILDFKGLSMDEKIEVINTLQTEIQTTQYKIDYYLKEIDTFLPSTK